MSRVTAMPSIKCNGLITLGQEPGKYRQRGQESEVTAYRLENDVRIETPQQYFTAHAGQWVIREPNGLVRTLRDQVFTDLFEPCER